MAGAALVLQWESVKRICCCGREAHGERTHSFSAEALIPLLKGGRQASDVGKIGAKARMADWH
jgi:hypothetical protein